MGMWIERACIVLDPARLAEEQPSTTPPSLITSEPTALVK